MLHCFDEIADNGKSIGEVRAGLDEKFNSEPSEADAFFGLLNYKNNQYGKAFGGIFLQNFNVYKIPHFANTLLRAVENENFSTLKNSPKKL